MAEQDPTNVGEQASNTPTGIGLSPDAQFRTLSKRMDDLATEVRAMPKPASFRLADGLQLAAIGVALLIAVFTAFGLSTRIDDVKTGQTGAESRINGQITSSEQRVTTRLDKLNDQFINLDERTATVEGAQKHVRK